MLFLEKNIWIFNDYWRDLVSWIFIHFYYQKHFLLISFWTSYSYLSTNQHPSAPSVCVKCRYGNVVELSTRLCTFQISKYIFFFSMREKWFFPQILYEMNIFVQYRFSSSFFPILLVYLYFYLSDPFGSFYILLIAEDTQIAFFLSALNVHIIMW